MKWLAGAALSAAAENKKKLHKADFNRDEAIEFSCEELKPLASPSHSRRRSRFREEVIWFFLESGRFRTVRND
jgi:hypothetical protein